MTGEEPISGGAIGYASRKLDKRDGGFSRQFELGRFEGQVSDGFVRQDPSKVAYIVQIGSEIPRLVTVELSQLNGTLGEEAAVRLALAQREEKLLGRTMLRGTKWQKKSTN